MDSLFAMTFTMISDARLAERSAEDGCVLFVHNQREWLLISQLFFHRTGDKVSDIAIIEYINIVADGSFGLTPSQTP